MGELIKRQKTAVAQASEEFVAVQTMAGRMHVRWDETAQATPHGQIVYFAEFLATADIFESWVQSCPLRYNSPSAPGVRDVLGTLMLSILAGSKRYAHIAGVRGDSVAALALGLNKIVSEDSVRRALKAIEPQAAQTWMHQALQASEASQGWQAIEDHLRLSGWSKERRVVVLRRRITRDVALTAKRGDKGQQLLALAFDQTQDDAQLWESGA